MQILQARAKLSVFAQRDRCRWTFSAGVSGTGSDFQLLPNDILSVALVDALCRRNDGLPGRHHYRSSYAPFVLVAAVDRLACGTHIKELLFGAAAGFGLYFLVYLLARLFYKKESFGMGDVVLLTAIGFFLSPAKTILVGILAFYCCLLLLLLLWIFKSRVERRTEIPFAPSICLSAFIVSLAGDAILAYLCNFLHIPIL